MILEKKSIRSLVNYQTKESPYLVKLDANEGKNILFPKGFDLSEIELNLYPDDQANLLRQRLSDYLNVPKEMIVEGNGSSELIELLIKTYVEPDETVLSVIPTFSMYQIYTEIHNARFVGIPSRNDFSIDIDEVIQAVKTYQPKLVFLCSPNNPTGYQMDRNEIIRLVSSTNSLVAVDEAYIEFADSKQSVIDDVQKYPNLVILRTFSKAFGLAGIRLGYLVGPEAIVQSIGKVKSPYHLNALSQAVGSQALLKIDEMRRWVDSIVFEREQLLMALKTMKIKTYPPFGNFIFIQYRGSLSTQLESKGILIRAYQGDLSGFYRITVGTPNENAQLIQALKEIIYG
jgi:histidinol-phosphate aminotransferase